MPRWVVLLRSTPSDQADDDEGDDAEDGCEQQHTLESDRAETPSRDRVLGHAPLPPHSLGKTDSWSQVRPSHPAHREGGRASAPSGVLTTQRRCVTSRWQVGRKTKKR